MQSGRLRKRIQIQRAAASRNSYGEQSQTWTTYKTVWGSVEPMTGRELWVAQQIQAEASLKVTIRYFSGLLKTDRIYWDSRTLEINAIINEQERNRKLELFCKEVV